MFWFILGFGAGTIFGIICTVVLLSKKGLETYANIQNELGKNVAAAKGAYEGYVAQELGEDEVSAEEQSEADSEDDTDESENNELEG